MDCSDMYLCASGHDAMWMLVILGAHGKPRPARCIETCDTYNVQHSYPCYPLACTHCSNWQQRQRRTIGINGVIHEGANHFRIARQLHRVCIQAHIDGRQPEVVPLLIIHCLKARHLVALCTEDAYFCASCPLAGS